jgi:hypothetical protein
MSDMALRDNPGLSVVLTTDTYETIRGVLRRLHQQTARHRTEVIVVVPTGQSSEFQGVDRRAFAGFRTVEISSLNPHWKARAAGIKAATAPLVFLGETHAYPDAGWAEALIAANESGHWGAIAPAFQNANPRGAVSWAAFLSDYGPWCEGPPAGEIASAPLFNSAYQRSALLELGDRLGLAVAQGDELTVTLRSRGYRAYFVAEARIAHLNITQPKAWLSEHFLVGITVGGHRGERWSRIRRLAYVLGSPLIPIVLTYRVFTAIRHRPGIPSVPAATFPLIFLGTVARAAGEMIGYAKGVGLQTESRAEEYELHKTAYAANRGSVRG